MERKEYDQTYQCIKREKEEEEDRLSLSLKESKRQLRNQKKNLKKEYREEKRDIRKQKKDAKQECKDKLVYLNETFFGKAHKNKNREKKRSPEERRTLRNRYKLPMYSRSEEIFNRVTHIVGSGRGVIRLILSIFFSLKFKPGDNIVLWSRITFSLTSIFLYTNSALYHGLYVNRGKSVFQVLDHCTIYVLIAGSYTPIVLLGLSTLTPWHYVYLGFVYALAILGVVLNATRMRKFAVKVISRIIYIALGWSIICFYPILVASLGLSSVWLLIGGGIAYTVGSILYGIGSKKKYWHSIFHIFCLVGTLLQFLSVLLYPVIGL